MTRCVSCSAVFQGYGQRGVCARCQTKYPAFVPKRMLSNEDDGWGRLGYTFRADGALRYDKSEMAVQRGDAPPKLIRSLHNPFAGVEKPRKRTAQERVNSLHKRLAKTFVTGQLPTSMIREVQQAQIARGVAPMSDTQLRQLAGYMLGQEDPTQAGVINQSRSVIKKG